MLHMPSFYVGCELTLFLVTFPFIQELSVEINMCLTVSLFNMILASLAPIILRLPPLCFIPGSAPR
jgi:hypothetical protein